MNRSNAFLLYTLIALILLVPSVVANGCVTPIESMQILDDTLICNGQYPFIKPFILSGHDYTLDCNGAKFISVDGGDVGVQVIPGAYNLTIKNCFFEGYITGIYSVLNSGMNISNNRIRLSRGYGIRFNLNKNSVIENNSITQNVNGISLWITNSTLITHNNISYNVGGTDDTQSGILCSGDQVSPPSTGNNITKNLMFNNAPDNILLDAHCFNSSVQDNDIYTANIEDIGENNHFCSIVLTNRYYLGATGPPCQPSEIDSDHDGYTSDIDCDDTKAYVNPGTGFCTDQTHTTTLTTGWSTISFPYAGGFKAQDILTGLGGKCNYISRWSGSAWQTHPYNTPINNFDIVRTEGYLVNCAQQASLDIDGQKSLSLLGYPTLNSGWNFKYAGYFDLNPATSPKMVDISNWLKQQYGYTKVYIAEWTGSSWRIYRSDLPVNNNLVNFNKPYLILGLSGSSTKSATIPIPSMTSAK
ncbi:right-handed parallel beta-helix repeat-containing protein [Candidatus Woesearchaeota archaeon]|nr:right-handed parallel beta-helix repeat-containing protein [Candidatus Woesearchaeota archaeon]